MRRGSAILLVVMMCVGFQSPAGARPPADAADAVVVAVVDFNFMPYHWDFLASKMPQARAGRGLPLDRPPHTWLPGFPEPKRVFDSYQPLRLSLEEKNGQFPLAVPGADAPEWEKVKQSTLDEVNYYWLPGTKVIGAVEFGNNKLVGDPRDHGVGVTSVSVGNIHGTCPECLLVFLNIDRGDEAHALRWALAQPWIDVVTNSYGHGVAKTYHGAEVEDGLKASERGQTVFFSAGNGIENAYVVPNSTYHSSEKGVDWFITVGAVSPGDGNHYRESRDPDNASYLGAGKPVDVAGIGLDYPSAYRASVVSGTGTSGFSGTSNAAPTIAGHYARSLYRARRALAGRSRIQRGGVVARGRDFRCGRARARCELRDGVLTAKELRDRLLLGAVHTAAGMTTYPGGHVPAIGEEEFMNEGHGTYRGRETDDPREWIDEFRRIVDPLLGKAPELERPDGEREWMVVDSYCRQQIWGGWDGGYYVEGKTELPGRDHAHPVRSVLETSCPALFPPP